MTRRAPSTQHRPKRKKSAAPQTTARWRQWLAKRWPTVEKGLGQYDWWQLVLSTIGALAVIGLAVMFFLPLGSGPTDLKSAGSMPAAGSDEFLSEMSRALTIPTAAGAAPQILNNGDGFLPSLLRDIDHAQKSIDFMVYIWEDGRFSDIVLDHLERRARAGVKVRLALDAYGAPNPPTEKLDRLKAFGAKVETFHSLMPMPWTITRGDKRNHRRSIVIDGTVGYTGGIAVSDTWLGNARNSSEWRDVMFRVGPDMAGYLQGAFAEVWEDAADEVLNGDRFYPLAPSPMSAGSTVKYFPLTSSPSPDSIALATFTLKSLLAARHSITIVTPYFLPDGPIEQALIERARSGCRVTVLVPNDNNDNYWVRNASRHLYGDLLRAGVHIFEYQPTFIHTKLLIIDDVWSVIGSANFDQRSRRLNEEVVFGVAGKDFALSLDNVVKGDLAKAKEISLNDWQERGLWRQLVEYVSLLAVNQY